MTKNTATEILKTNAGTALKTSGANAANKALIAAVKRMFESQLGVKTDWMDTPLGQALVCNAVPALALYGLDTELAQAHLSENFVNRARTGFTYASAGAMNESFALLFAMAIPFLTEFVNTLPDDAFADAEAVEQEESASK